MRRPRTPGSLVRRSRHRAPRRTGINMTSAHIVCLANASLACVFDLRTRRIPNALTFGAALAALLFHRFTGGTEGAMLAAGGWVVGLFLFLPFFAMRGMGGGDVKLLA